MFCLNVVEFNYYFIVGGFLKELVAGFQLNLFEFLAMLLV